ncbi:MAG: nickel ABC transporter permease subunit NikC, partial [Methanosarcinaceae archaeon]
MISLLRDVRDFGKNRAAMMGLLVICTLIIIALLADVISPYDPTKIILEDKLQAPSIEHIMGTDHLGRDVLSRII